MWVNLMTRHKKKISFLCKGFDSASRLHYVSDLQIPADTKEQAGANELEPTTQ